MPIPQNSSSNLVAARQQKLFLNVLRPRRLLWPATCSRRTPSLSDLFLLLKAANQMTRIDFLFIRRSARPGGALFSGRPPYSRSSPFRPLFFIIPIAALIYMVWPGSGADHQTVEPLTPHERMRWSYFHEEVDEASQVQTLDEAFAALMGLRHSVNYLPYKIERHRRDANGCLDTAESHLSACHVQRREHPSYWRAELTKALREIPKEALRLDNTPPPPTIDGE